MCSQHCVVDEVVQSKGKEVNEEIVDKLSYYYYYIILTFSMFRDSRPDFVAYDVKRMRGFFGTIDLGDADSDLDAADTMETDEVEGFTIESKLSKCAYSHNEVLQ